MIFYCLGVNLCIILSTPLTSSPGNVSYHHTEFNSMSFYHVTFDVFKLMFACAITLFYLIFNFISLKVRFVTFDTDLSLLRKNLNRHDDLSFFLFSLWVHRLLYASLFDTGLLLFSFNDNLLYFSCKHRALICVQKFLYVKIHKICFNTFRY